MRRYSLDSSVSLDSGSLLGRRRGSRQVGKRLKQIDSIQEAQLQIQKRRHSLDRSDARDNATESFERSDELITNPSFVKQNKIFHKLFPDVPEGENLTHTFACSLQREVLYHGKLFLSEQHVCFYSSVLLKDTKVAIPTSSVSEVKKHKLPMSMLTIHTVDGEKHSLLSMRKSSVCYKLLQSLCSQLQQGESPNSSPHGSSAENEVEHVTTSRYSSMDDSLDQSSNRNSFSLDEFSQLSYGEDGREVAEGLNSAVLVHDVLNSSRQNSMRAEEETEAAASWTRHVTQGVASFVFLRDVAAHHVFFWVFFLLLVLLLLASGYIGLRIIALEEQLNSLGALTEVYFRNTDYKEK